MKALIITIIIIIRILIAGGCMSLPTGCPKRDNAETVRVENYNVAR